MLKRKTYLPLQPRNEQGATTKERWTAVHLRDEIRESIAFEKTGKTKATTVDESLEIENNIL